MNLRSQSRIYEMSIKDATNPDTKAFLDGSAKDLMRDARALHRALYRLGVRGLGPLV